MHRPWKVHPSPAPGPPPPRRPPTPRSRTRTVRRASRGRVRVAVIGLLAVAAFVGGGVWLWANRTVSVRVNGELTQVSADATLEEIAASEEVETTPGDLVSVGGNVLTELSGYSVRIGYPRPLFSGGGCIGVHEADAATSIGMILAAANDNCEECTVPEEYPSKNTSVVVEDLKETDIVEEDKKEQTPEPDHKDSLFDEDEIEKVKPEKPDKKKAERGKDKVKKVTWGDRLKKAVNQFTGSLYDNMNNEEI